MRTRPWTLALCGWTYLVWTTRLWNIWRDATLDLGEQWGRSALALTFTVLATVVLVGLRWGASWTRTAVVVLTAWTVGVWTARMVAMVGDHGVAFVVVHTVLAVVSVALGLLAVREQRDGAARSAEPVG